MSDEGLTSHARRVTLEEASAQQQPIGYLAMKYCGESLPLQVLESQNGFYIGTVDEDGLPCSRESVQYWATSEAATEALASGMWTQKMHP